MTESSMTKSPYSAREKIYTAALKDANSYIAEMESSLHMLLSVKNVTPNIQATNLLCVHRMIKPLGAHKNAAEHISLAA